MANLPGPDANLTECIEFCRKNDPSQEFRERWGADFPDRAGKLWGASTHAFKAGRATSKSQTTKASMPCGQDTRTY